MAPARAVGLAGSRPSRARGSKLAAVVHNHHMSVAPFAGAWIETTGSNCASADLTVAPFAGAWIETRPGPPFWPGWQSRPSRARGSKLCGCQQRPRDSRSRPSRARGSKRSRAAGVAQERRSRPSRARGSKHIRRSDREHQKHVAPFAGAWIETPIALCGRCCVSVAPFAGAWIETTPCFREPPSLRVAPFAGAWIETPTRTPASASA